MSDWKKEFNSRFDYSIIESVIRDMGDDATWLTMKKNIMLFIQKEKSLSYQEGVEIGKKIAEWAVSGDTGLSSMAIMAHMMGIKDEHGFCAPSDADDRGRCIRLLDRFPEWWDRLDEMKQYPSRKVTTFGSNAMDVRDEGWTEQIPLIRQQRTAIQRRGK